MRDDQYNNTKKKQLIRTKDYLHKQSKIVHKFKDDYQQRRSNSGNPCQQMSLINSQETTERWNQMASTLAEWTNKFPEETLMMRSNWDQRRKQEVSNLVDLTSTVNEKYGMKQSFLLKLRIQDDDPQTINYKNPVSSRWQDPNFGAMICDDR